MVMDDAPSEVVRLRLHEDDLQTRDATDADRALLYDVHRAALGPWVRQVWGWDEADQRARFARDFRPSAAEVVVFAGADVGTIRVEATGAGLFLDYVALLPAAQRRGLGTRLVRAVLARAAERRVPVELNVLQINPARALYERLGFRVVAEMEHKWRMRAEAA
jgi:ribosomal protein S18 acetylase RimI-like enzyme